MSRDQSSTGCEFCADTAEDQCVHCMRDERDRYRDTLMVIDRLMTTVSGDNIPRGATLPLHVRGLVRTALGRKP